MLYVRFVFWQMSDSTSYPFIMDRIGHVCLRVVNDSDMCEDRDVYVAKCSIIMFARFSTPYVL